MEKKDWLIEVDILAKLSKLSFTQAEKEVFVEEFQQIVAFADVIAELDLKGVEPLVYINQDDENKTREDVVQPVLSREAVLSNAPSKDSDYFRVPKILDNDSSLHS